MTTMLLTRHEKVSFFTGAALGGDWVTMDEATVYALADAARTMRECAAMVQAMAAAPACSRAAVGLRALGECRRAS